MFKDGFDGLFVTFDGVDGEVVITEALFGDDFTVDDFRVFLGPVDVGELNLSTTGFNALLAEGGSLFLQVSFTLELSELGFIMRSVDDPLLEFREFELTFVLQVHPDTVTEAAFHEGELVHGLVVSDGTTDLGGTTEERVNFSLDLFDGVLVLASVGSGSGTLEALDHIDGDVGVLADLDVVGDLRLVVGEVEDGGDATNRLDTGVAQHYFFLLLFY